MIVMLLAIGLILAINNIPYVGINTWSTIVVVSFCVVSLIVACFIVIQSKTDEIPIEQVISNSIISDMRPIILFIAGVVFIGVFVKAEYVYEGFDKTDKLFVEFASQVDNELVEFAAINSKFVPRSVKEPIALIQEAEYLSVTVEDDGLHILAKHSEYTKEQEEALSELRMKLTECELKRDDTISLAKLIMVTLIIGRVVHFIGITEIFNNVKKETNGEQVERMGC